jgi:hypothetical protein
LAALPRAPARQKQPHLREQDGPEIIKQVLEKELKPFGRGVRLELAATIAKREYCAQIPGVGPTLSAMLFEGMFFYFDKSGKTETVVLVDSNFFLPEVETMPWSRCLSLRRGQAGSTDLDEDSRGR